MKINNVIPLFVKQIIRHMSDSQIKLLQNWLFALGDALFALRAEAKSEPLGFIQQHKKDKFEWANENVHFCYDKNSSPSIPGYFVKLPRKQGEDFVEATNYFRLRKDENGFYTLLYTGVNAEHLAASFANDDTPNHSSFGIKIINIEDESTSSK